MLRQSKGKNNKNINEEQNKPKKSSEVRGIVYKVLFLLTLRIPEV
jgi:hypothetical protein